MDQSVEQLARDLALAQYSRRTRQGYVAEAKRLATFCNKTIAEVTREELRAYVEERASSGVAPSSLRKELLGLLFLYRRTLGRPEMVSFIKLPRVHSPLPTVLSLEEVHALLRNVRNPRYQSIAMVMYGAGLRISETIALEARDVDGARSVIQVRHGKGDKAREVKMSPSLYEWLRQYWARTRPTPPYLFASPKTGKLPTLSTIRKALRLAAKQAFIKKRVTPHVLRHSFATHLLDEGIDVHVIQALLGHANINSTARYARVTQKRIRETPSPLDLLPQRR